MQNNIKEIFSAITPDNIKNIPVVRDQMDIFIEILEELSKESIDIRNAFENTRIKEELIKIYLDDLYTVFKQIQFNQSIDELIEKTNAF
jgi:predicted transcriptional regulator